MRLDQNDTFRYGALGSLRLLTAIIFTFVTDAHNSSYSVPRFSISKNSSVTPVKEAKRRGAEISRQVPSGASERNERQRMLG